LIDFSAFRGTTLTLVNTLAPPLPPGTSSPNPDVMQFRVRAKRQHDPFVLPGTLSPSFVRLTHTTLPGHAHRWLALTLLDQSHPEMWEMVEIDVPPAGLAIDGIVPVKAADGTVKTLQRISRDFADAANFYVEHGGLGAVEHPEPQCGLAPDPHPPHQVPGPRSRPLRRRELRHGGRRDFAPVAYQHAGVLEPWGAGLEGHHHGRRQRARQDRRTVRRRHGPLHVLPHPRA
jgi:hypothetical protein